MAYLAAAGVGVFLAWRLTKAAGAAVEAVGQGASYVGDVLTGAEDPVGDWLGWYPTHGDNNINPASSDNVVNTAVTAAGRAITGDQYWTLGGWIYEKTH